MPNHVEPNILVEDDKIHCKLANIRLGLYEKCNKINNKLVGQACNKTNSLVGLIPQAEKLSDYSSTWISARLLRFNSLKH